MTRTESSLVDQRLRAAVPFVYIANLGYFGVEFVVTLVVTLVALFADSIDFLEA